MPVRLSDPLPLRLMAPSLRGRLAPLTLRRGHLRTLLAELPPALVVVALDERCAIGWAVAERDGLLGCYVAPRCRRRGIGRRLVGALWPAARALWPEAEWSWAARRGTPGVRFWRAMGAEFAGTEA